MTEKCSPAMQTSEEAEYIKVFLEKERLLPDDVSPSPIVSVLLSVAGVILYPLRYLLVNMARRREKVAWSREASKEPFTPHRNSEIRHPAGESIKKWKLHCHNGRQVWEHNPNKDTQSYIESVHSFGTNGSSKRARDADEALQLATSHIHSLQSEDGHWSNDYGGPLFLLPGLVITMYIINDCDQKKIFTPVHRAEFLRYLYNIQNSDGGFGLHDRGPSTVFGTALNYVTMRLLLNGKNDQTEAALRFLQSLDTPLHNASEMIPTWGKAWLAILNLFSWDGVRPVTPELWLLPKWLPFHPGRMWCHTRMVYVPLGYLFGRRFSAPETELITEIRSELFPRKVQNWNKAMHVVSSVDIHYPAHVFAKAAFFLLGLYEKMPNSFLRKKSLDTCIQHVKYDDVTTNFICLGPVNKVFNLLAVYCAEGRSEHLLLSEKRVYDYIWLGNDGLKMNGYNGSQLWDTAFTLQALRGVSSSSEEIAEKQRQCIQGGLRYIDAAQVLSCPPNVTKYCRDSPLGAWNFSTAEQNWSVSDCTSEGLRCAILFKSLSRDRILLGIDQIMLLRNSEDGAWCSYEPRRSPVYMELLNPADVFSRIMVEYTYTECTSACMQTLQVFQDSEYFKGYRQKEINDAIQCGVRTISNLQEPDGSWYGSWGVCFTYGTLFGIEGLLAGGVSVDDPRIVKGVQFLLSKQRSDGGWSEHVHSCASRQYTEAPEGSQPVQTSLALMALIVGCPREAKSGSAHINAIHRAAEFLVSSQVGGTWEQKTVAGIFNGTCGIHYPYYPVILPVWALGKYQKLVASL